MSVLAMKRGAGRQSRLYKQAVVVLKKTGRANAITKENSGGTQPTRGADVRSRIVDAALHTFAAHGFGGATMQEIADMAAVKLPLIVYHFGSKRKLWESVVDQ